MPTSPTRRRWVTLAALTSAAGLAFGGCSGTPTAEPSPDREPLPDVAPTAQPVADPAASSVLDGEPLTAPRFEAPVSRPNLLMITVDDAAWGDMEHMPHLQRLLADQGVTLERGTAPTPLCVPARASLLTGQYAANHGALSISGPAGGFKAFDDADTLPVWLQDAGYDTMFVGKYLNGYGKKGTGEYVPPGWSTWRAAMDPSTYNFAEQTISVDGTPEHAVQYSTDRYRDLTVDLLEDPERQDKPWYMWVNYVAPHTGGPPEPDDPRERYPRDRHAPKTTRPADRDRDTFSDLDLPDNPSVFEKDVSDKVVVRATHRQWNKRHRNQFRLVRQRRVEALQSVDRAIRATVRTLRRTGQLESTYIVFTSDNGYAVGEHNLLNKLWFYRDIIGIPTYVRGPGLPKGKTSATPVTNADWAPTFAALAGATPTRLQDGVDVTPWLSRPRRAGTRVIPIEAWPPRSGGESLYAGVTTGDLTYVKGRKGRVEVYDLRTDPWQLHNVARDPRYAELVSELGELSASVRDCAGDSCPQEFYR